MLNGTPRPRSAERWYIWHESSPSATKNWANMWQGGSAIFGRSAGFQCRQDDPAVVRLVLERVEDGGDLVDTLPGVVGVHVDVLGTEVAPLPAIHGTEVALLAVSQSDPESRYSRDEFPSQMRIFLSCSVFADVSPDTNHSNSSATPRQKTDFVVSSGKRSRSEKRICTPNFDSVPTPVRSSRRTPVSITSRTRFRYCSSS